MSAITTLDKSAVLARAQAAISNRTRYVETLFDAATEAAAAHSAVAGARDAAATADAAFEKAYRDAITAGWTAAELKAAGLPTPSKTGPARKRSAAGTARRRGATSAASTNTPDANNDSAETTEVTAGAQIHSQRST